MYENLPNLDFKAFFNMSSTPFTQNIPVEALYQSEQFLDSMGRLLYAAKNKQFAVLTAAPGCGKSTLLRALSAELDDDKYTILYVSDSNLSARWLYAIPLTKMGYEAKFHTKDARIQLQDMLYKEMEVKGKNVVIIVDEAHLVDHHNNRSTLQEIRFMLNCEFDSGNPLSLILSGQNELWDLIAHKDHKAIIQRIDQICKIPALDNWQVAQYIETHLKYAGTHDTIISSAAIEMISNASAGVPRVINKICTHSLIYAAKCRQSVINEDLVRAVIERELPPNMCLG